MTQPGSILWLARHELTLGWRDLMWIMTAGNPRRREGVLIVAAVVVVVLHAVAYLVVGHSADVGRDPSKATLVAMTGSAFLAWALMLSQAMESVTRAFYSRADLDLVLASPASSHKIFAIRIAGIAFGTATMSLLLAGPFINVLAVLGGAQWLAAYGVVIAMSATAAASAVALTVGLFRMIGPRRTRLVAQVVAALVGAGFVIGVQIVSILNLGDMSRRALFASDWVIDASPSIDSIAWLPARAGLGDLGALLIVSAVGLATLLGAILAFAGGFAGHATAAAGVAFPSGRQARPAVFSVAGNARATLRLKELRLLKRDAWLVSQTLMQLIYLIPPAVLLWRDHSMDAGSLVVVAPVLVMAAGQLAGGLAWLTISGEDAPDLVATAPLAPSTMIWAKIDAVLFAVGIVSAPILAALLFISPIVGLMAGIGLAAAAGSATAIQLFFRAQAKRTHFRRRQVSSRLATFAEAFSSISWAAATGLAAAGTAFAIAPAAIALGVVAVAWVFSPMRLQGA
jgi:ABC-2 type transport system permease protein